MQTQKTTMNKNHLFLGIVFSLIIGVVMYTLYSESIKNEKNIEEQNTKLEENTNNAVEEKNAVELFVRQNISNIATNDEVLGGTWYVVSIDIDTASDTASVVYEDGHIQSRAILSYLYNSTDKSLKIQNFAVVE